ncbi:hemin uptake system outer membrane receptor [Helicobacter didelphidarum]|uniref:Hemin uptake system outer membrane receptor n=1 Tax=Helicobacter didelphidarum TaxID=2040648 RepID=A0A3D8IR13_9HELI|nr:TonB-dependent receptor [Helicobacter didelphidarum]RDU67051.1 hemin uptake system outer membrane receptor [Helicobacter didelphidarum]
MKFKKCFQYICSLFAISIMLDEIIYANETPATLLATSNPGSEITKISTQRLNVIITSTTGFDLPLKEEAKNILLINKEQLSNKGYQSLEQALQYQPLLTFSNNGFGNNIDLRGQGMDANRSVKILVNRVPISLLDTSHGVPTYNNIDIEDIESIEVIPGGGAVVYGNGTRGGVVNIVTKAPSKDFVRIVLKANSGKKVGLQGTSLSVAGGKRVNDNLFLRADISGGYQGGVRNTQGVDTAGGIIKAFKNDNNTNVYGAFQALYEINANHKLDFNINYSHLWTSYPRAYLTMANDVGTTNNPIYEDKPQSEILSQWNTPDKDTIKTQSDSTQASLNYTGKFSESLSFDALAFYQFSKLRYTDYEFGSGTFDGTAWSGGTMDMGNNSGFQNQGGGLNLKFKHEIEKNTLIIGLDNIVENSKRQNYIYHTFLPKPSGSQNPMNYYISDTNNIATKLSNSLYIFDNIKFTKAFELSAGARVEYSNYWTSNNQTYQQSMTIPIPHNPTIRVTNEAYNFNLHTSRLGYAAEITPNFKYSDSGNVYAKAELGFISPSAFQMINADPNSTLNVGNSGTLNQNESNGIKPERYLTGEIGWRDAFRWSYLSATIFYTHTFDEIFVNSIEHGTSYAYSNLGQTQRAGIEIMASQSIGSSDWLRLSEGISYLYTNVLKTNIANAHLRGNSVPYVPFLKATLNIEISAYKSETRNLTIFWNNAYVSQSRDTTAGSQNGETITDGSTHIMNKGGYFLSDLGLMYGIRDFTINLGIRNLFNSHYATYQKYPYYQPAMGRSYFLEFRYNL